MWDWGVILAECSRNVAIYITRDYIVRQTAKNLALLLFPAMNNHNLFYDIFTYIITLLKKMKQPTQAKQIFNDNYEFR